MMPLSFSPPDAAIKFFRALDQQLKAKRLRLDEFIAAYDRDGNQGLDEDELRRLAQAILPGACDAQVQYLQVS